MGIIGRLLSICVLLFYSEMINAEQGCPDGMIPNAAPTGTPGQNQCVPMPGLINGGEGSSMMPKVRWSTRWGAFTSDSVTSKVGVSSGASSKRKAEKEAILDCKKRGGILCEVILSFNNQCGAIAWGERLGDKGILSVVSAASDDQAKAAALEQCSLKSGACKIFLSECSYAERIR